MKRIIIAVLLLFAGAVQAQEAPPAAAIHELRVSVLRDAYLFSSSAGTAKGVEDATRGTRTLDRLLTPAIDAARNHDDLTAAIKAFYVAAKTYFDSALAPVPPPSYDVRFGSRPSPESVQLKATQAKLKADLDAKANAMQLEARLAGFEV